MCETLDPAGEPGAGNRHAGFGERLLETDNRVWIEALTFDESCQKQPPPLPKLHRASSRLNYPNSAMVLKELPQIYRIFRHLQ